MFKIGVVGLGLGRQHAERVLNHPADWKLTSVCDALEERGSSFANRRPGIRAFVDYDTFVEQADVDGVVLALPHDLHLPMAVRALEAGKHVLVEKPMSRTVAECQIMNAAARRAGTTLMVGQNWRYTPWVRAVKQVVDSGELGPLRAVRTDWLQRVIGDQRPGNWLVDGLRAGGGPFISLVVHNVDCLRYLLGEPVSVHADCLYGHPEFRNNAEYWGMAQCRFENGVIGQMFTSYAAFAPADSGPLWLYGDEGTLYKQDAVQISTSRRGEGYHALEVRDNAGLPTTDPYLNELLHFAECARTGAPPLSSGEDNVHTIRFIEAMYESARSGRVVSLPTPTQSRAQQEKGKSA